MFVCSKETSELIFYVNGQKVIESRPCPQTFLVTYLRETLNLRGTKVACGEGGCGSCTVMVSRFDRKTSAIKHEARYACMTPICALHGLSVTTVEALGSTRTQMHKLQKSLVDGHGVQCGFCTPGMLMSMYALLRNNSKPNDLDIENALRGNLCRCTGYRPILESFKMGIKDLQFDCPLGEKCCKNEFKNHNDKEAHLHDISKDEIIGKDFIFPNELQLTDQYDKQNLTFCANDITWLSPCSKDELLTLKRIHSSSQVIAGGNIMAYKLKPVPQTPQILISTTRIREFYEVFINEKGITLFPNVTISDLESVLQEFKWADSKPHFIDSLLEMCQRIASVQIRNTSTVCGGLAQGFHGSDLNVLLLVADCKVTFQSYEGERLVDVNFELLSSKPQLRSNEIISRLFIPLHNNKNKFFGFYKLSPRKDFSRAILNCGFSVEFDGTADCHVENAIFIYGGQFTKPLVMSQLGTYTLRKSWRKELLPGCLDEIEKDFKVLKNQGSISGSDDDLSYILFSMQGLFVKFFVKLLIKLSKIFPELDSPDDDITSAAFWEDNHNRDLHSGTQVYNSDHSKCSVQDLGKPLPHRWANQSTTGEAVFIDDQRLCKGELCLSIVKSSKAHANILKVDYSEALKMPGVVDYIDHTSVQGSNIFQIFSPMELFATKTVTYVGQPIGAILAQTHEQGRSACSLVCVEYEELPSIISIEDAIKHNSFHHVLGGGIIKRGDSEKAFQELCDEVLENEISIGGQEHFYMETHCCRVVPLVEDGGELEVFAGSQYSDGLQKVVSQTVNLPQNKVNIRVKRMGGAFGGKELSSWLTVLPCAVAALKFNLPVRCMLTRRDDMQMTGNRRPYKAKYKVGFTKEGIIKALNLKMFSNDGVTPDWTLLMGITLMNCDSVYNIPNISASGSCCKTNLPPCTAMRGAGCPQAVIIAESIISDIAIHLDKPAHEIRELNMYEAGCLSLANSPIDDSLHKCYNEVKLQSNFIELCQKVQHFNSENKYVKQAVSLLPIKFSPCFPPFMNKGAAFLNIYKDGTVLLSHGGVECGQGLHTKMIQVASRALGIPASYIRIGETSTSVIPNAQGTGGSTGSDINGMAVVDACEQINERLKSIKESNPSRSWEDVVGQALEQKINLSAFGFWNGAYNEEYDWQSGKGRAHSYYTYGAIVAHVEVDCLTGNHVVLQVDVVMDVGKSLNPAIDVGQIEGGIVMGLGMCLLEEHKYSTDGNLESAGTDKYHIPTIGNIPLQMNVTLLKNSGNDKAVYSSKGIGEPPLLLSASVWLAIKEVVAEMRKKNDGVAASGSNVFVFNTPATPKHVIIACNPRKI